MELRIATWNVLADAYLRPQYYPHLDTMPEPFARSSATAAVIADVAAGVDVIAAQEVEAHIAELIAALPGWESRWAQRPGRSDGTLLAVRATHTPTFTTTQVAVGDHVQVRCELTADGHHTTVSSVHLSWAEHDNPNHPALPQIAALDTDIVTGDLNASDGPVIATLTKAGYQCAFPVAATASINGTTQASIDAVCARNTATVTSINVFATVTGPLPDNTFPSDHVPVIATVQLRHVR